MFTVAPLSYKNQKMCYFIQLASTGEVSCFFCFCMFFRAAEELSFFFYAFLPFFKARNSELHTTLLDYFSFLRYSLRGAFRMAIA